MHARCRPGRIPGRSDHVYIAGVPARARARDGVLVLRAPASSRSQGRGRDACGGPVPRDGAGGREGRHGGRRFAAQGRRAQPNAHVGLVCPVSRSLPSKVGPRIIYGW